MTLTLPVARTDRSGIAVMILAMSVVPLIDVLAKFLVLDGLHALQLIFVRMGLGALLVLPMVRRAAPGTLRLKGGWATAFLMGGLNVAAAGCFFSALFYLSIADTVAISFVQPLFITLISCFVLREKVSLIRWMAIAAGFLAMLLIIRPGMVALNPGSLLALASGFCMACYVVVVRHSATGSTPSTPLALTWYTHVTAVALVAPVMLFVWVTPDLRQWGMLAGLTLVGLAGQYLIIKAYRLTEASLVAPFAYFEIVTSVLVSWAFFAEVPDQVTFLGVILLMISSLIVLQRG